MGEDVRLDVVLVRGRSLEVEMRGLGLRSLVGLSRKGHRCLLLCTPGSGPPLPNSDTGAPVPTRMFGDIPPHRKVRLVTPGGPARTTPRVSSAQCLRRRRGGVLQELGAALVLLLLADLSRGTGEGVQGAQEAPVRLVLQGKWWMMYTRT